MTPFLLLLLLVGEKVSSQEEDDNLQYGFCEGANRPMYLAYINIQPWPVILSAGETLQILAHIYLNNTIREGSQVMIELSKTSGDQSVAVPCVNTTQWGQVGSCLYSGDDFTDLFFHHFFCPNNGIEEPCSLPILPGHYGQQYDKPYIVTLPNITLDMDWFLTGIFNIKLRVLNSDGSEFTCLEFVVSVEQRQELTTSTVIPPGPDTCDDCQSQIENILNSLVEDSWLVLQENYLRDNACLEPGVESSHSPACQRFIMKSWRDGYARSLYSSWMLDDLTCKYFGQCQGNSKYWGCTEVMLELADTLSSQDTASGAVENLQRDFCGADTVCMDEVKVWTSTLLTSLSEFLLLENTKLEMCDQNSSVTTTPNPVMIILLLTLCLLQYSR